MDPWFIPQHAALASFAALVSLLYLLEPYAQRGKRLGALTAICGVVFAIGTAILAVAAYALAIQQPPYVYLTLCFAGGIVAIFSALGFVRLLYLGRHYAQASAGSGRNT